MSIIKDLNNKLDVSRYEEDLKRIRAYNIPQVLKTNWIACNRLDESEGFFIEIDHGLNSKNFHISGYDLDTNMSLELKWVFTTNNRVQILVPKRVNADLSLFHANNVSITDVVLPDGKNLTIDDNTVSLTNLYTSSKIDDVYSKKSDVTNIVEAHVNTLNQAINKKLNVEGHVLTENNFTTVYRNKLDHLSNYDDTEVKESITNLSTDLGEKIDNNHEELTTKISTINSTLETKQNEGIERWIRHQNNDKSLYFAGDNILDDTNAYFSNCPTKCFYDRLQKVGVGEGFPLEGIEVKDGFASNDCTIDDYLNGTSTASERNLDKLLRSLTKDDKYKLVVLSLSSKNDDETLENKCENMSSIINKILEVNNTFILLSMPTSVNDKELYIELDNKKYPRTSLLNTQNLLWRRGNDLILNSNYPSQKGFEGLADLLISILTDKDKNDSLFKEDVYECFIDTNPLTDIYNGTFILNSEYEDILECLEEGDILQVGNTYSKLGKIKSIRTYKYHDKSDSLINYGEYVYINDYTWRCVYAGTAEFESFPSLEQSIVVNRTVFENGSAVFALECKGKLIEVNAENEIPDLTINGAYRKRLRIYKKKKKEKYKIYKGVLRSNNSEVDKMFLNAGFSIEIKTNYFAKEKICLAFVTGEGFYLYKDNSSVNPISAPFNLSNGYRKIEKCNQNEVDFEAYFHIKDYTKIDTTKLISRYLFSNRTYVTDISEEKTLEEHLRYLYSIS